MEIKDLPAREILLSPISLLHTIFVVLVPGLLSIFLLAMKHSPVVTTAISASGMLGYKTKITLVLFIAFVIGTVIQAAVIVVGTSTSWALENRSQWFKKSKHSASTDDSAGQHQTPENHDGQTSPEIFIAKYEDNQASPEVNVADAPTPTSAQKTSKLTLEQKQSRRFFTAFVLGALVSKETRAFDSWETNRARAGLAVCSGLVLFVAGFYPGDGLRVYEVISGILLMTMGTIQSMESRGLITDLIGQAAGRVVAQHTIKENIEILQMTNKLLPVITPHINPTPSEQVPVKLVEEVAERSIGKSVNSQQKRKKKGRR